MMLVKRFTVFLTALALLAWGLSGGEQTRVLRKAATICLECVGIG